MTSLEFREQHHEEFAALLRDPLVIKALTAVMMDRPKSNSNACKTRDGAVDPIQAGEQLGRIAGYELCYTVFRSLATRPAAPKEKVDVPMNYQQPRPVPQSDVPGAPTEPEKLAPDPISKPQTES